MSRVTAALLALVSFAACTGPEPSCETTPSTGCAAGEFHYRDQTCAARVDAGPGDCMEVGDGVCYQTCTADSDCVDPCRPYCRRLGLYSGGDFYCNGSVMICRHDDVEFCVR